jgi:hypothetical protein
MSKVKPITVRAEILEDMFVCEEQYEKVGTFVDPQGEFTGWYIEANYETGEFEGSKSSMTEFEVYLYRPWKEGDKLGREGEHIYVGTAIGGYYNEYVGYSFSSDLEFYPETPESEFKDFLSILIGSDYSLDKMIKKIEKEIKNLK